MILKKKQLAIRVGQACTAIAIAAASQTVWAQETARVEITGSSIKRVLEEQALPVQIITREDISKSGAVNIESLLASLPGNSSAGGVTHSMGAGNSTYGRSSISLRGLGDQRTLVLINGRRMAPFGTNSSSVDINAIPMETIERIEVLTDGASSIYGSDAMAGVVNFILRKDFQGIEMSVDFGSPTTSGGGKTDKWSVVAGKGSLAQDKYNFMFSAGTESQTELKAVDRAYSKSGNNPPFYTNGATGGGNIEGIWSTVPGAGDTRAANSSTGSNAGPASGAQPLGINSRYYGNPLADSVACNQDGHFLQGAAAGLAPRFPSTSAGRCTFDSAPFVRLVPKTDKKNVSGSFTIKLDAVNEFYGSASWVQNLTLQAIQPAPVRTSFLATDTAFIGSGVSPALLIRPTNPNYPTAWLNAHGLGAMVGSVLAVTQRAFVAGERTTNDESVQTRLNLGFKGAFMGWDYDTAFSRDQSTVKGKVIDGFFSQLELARALNNTTNNWNPWSVGGVQPANVAAEVAKAKYIGPTATGQFTSTSWDGRLSNTVGKLAGGDVGLSVGTDIRHQQYEIFAPAILATGDIAGLGGATLPVKAGRTITSLFSEINLPILTNLEANASIRGDKYSDLLKDASPVTGKLSARWTPISMLVVRTSYGTGFRAPSLSELYTPESVGTTEQYTDPVGGANYQANSKTGGNASLVPETSKQWTLGAVVTPMKNVSLRADYFSVKVDKYVTSATAQALVNQAGGVNSAFVTFSGPGTAAVLIDERSINAGLAKFAGFDLGANWSDKFSFGKLTVDYNGTRMTKASLKTPDGTEDALSKQVDLAGAALKLTSIGGTIHKYKHTLSFDWSLGPWGATFTQNYTDRYEDEQDLNGNRHFVPAYSIYDLQMRFNGVKNLNLAIGAKNVFNKQPPLYINPVNFFSYGYDPAQYDPLGRFVYAKATYKF